MNKHLQYVDTNIKNMEGAMKVTDKNQPIKTIPKGVWEANRPTENKGKGSNTTDLQGNGYPSNKQSK